MNTDGRLISSTCSSAAMETIEVSLIELARVSYVHWCSNDELLWASTPLRLACTNVSEDTVSSLLFSLSKEPQIFIQACGPWCSLTRPHLKQTKQNQNSLKSVDPRVR
jgi:hypothetical protein